MFAAAREGNLPLVRLPQDLPDQFRSDFISNRKRKTLVNPLTRPASRVNLTFATHLAACPGRECQTYLWPASFRWRKQIDRQVSAELNDNDVTLH
jgi:hypothetical protein